MAQAFKTFFRRATSTKAASRWASRAQARRMIVMTLEINTKLLAGFPPGRDEAMPAVTCYTCHRGQTKPLTVRPPEAGKL